MWIITRHVLHPGVLKNRLVLRAGPRLRSFSNGITTQGAGALLKRARRTVEFISRSVGCERLYALGELHRNANQQNIPEGLPEKIESYNSLKNSLAQLEELLDVAGWEKDPEFRNEVLSELAVVDRKLYDLWLGIVCEYLDTHGCRVEIMCGAGGQESCDWVAVSRDMYMHWAARQGYGVRVLDEETEGQGCRSSTLEIEGKYAYDFLRNESGLHRFTRVSPYGGGAKIHTSFIGIKVTPVDGNQDAGVNSEKEIKIDMKDVKIETMRARGPGGQHVNKTESAVRIMHFPTKIIVSCQSERDQHSNREQAFEILRSRLYELEVKKRREQKAKIYSEEPNISWGSKIRNYTILRNAVKDFRTGLEIKDCHKVFSGEGLHQFMEEILVSCSEKRHLSISKNI